MGASKGQLDTCGVINVNLTFSFLLLLKIPTMATKFPMSCVFSQGYSVSMSITQTS